MPQVKELSVTSVSRDGMPFRRVPERLAADVHVYPVTSTVWEWHRHTCEAIDLPTEYEPWVTARFSGVLCLDEVYDGAWCVILSTDPLNDVTVAYTIETKEEGQQRPMLKQDWLERHLAALCRMGIQPQVVIRDGAVVYDEGLPSDWEQARCQFHLIQDMAAEVLKAVNAYRKTLPDPPKRAKGRPRAEAPPPEPDVKAAIWHHRYLFVTRPETLQARQGTCAHETHVCCHHPEEEILQTLCADHPPLATARTFMEEIWSLFDDPTTTFPEVKERYERLCATPAYRDDPHLARALACLSGDTLEKACRFLSYTNLPKTNNHVEGAARRFRKRQKSHYKLRQSATIDRAMKAELLRQKARHQARGTPVVHLQTKTDAQHQTLPAQAA